LYKNKIKTYKFELSTIIQTAILCIHNNI